MDSQYQIQFDSTLTAVKSNIAGFFLRSAHSRLEQVAIHFYDQTTDKTLSYTFKEIRQLALSYSQGLLDQGFYSGDRIIVLLPVSIELYALLLGTLIAGVIPVILDPALSKKQLLVSAQHSGAAGIISSKQAFKLRFFIPALWRLKKYSVDSCGFGVRSLLRLKSDAVNLDPDRLLKTLQLSDPAILTYTTGSTGIPKAADRNQSILSAQHQISRELWKEDPDEIDLPCFPMIALQNLSCGITTVLPKMNFRKQDSFDAKVVVDQIISCRVTRLSAAPAFLRRLCDYLLEQDLSLTQIRRLIAGGATVPRSLCTDILKCFPNAAATVVYGSTEAEPICHVSMNEICQEPENGYLVGSPIPMVQLKIVSLSGNFEQSLDSLPQGATGEILISGPHVVKRYHGNEAANAETKIRAKDGTIWHRTGDMGLIDQRGRVWLVGRLTDAIRVKDQFVPNYLWEQKLEAITGVQRAAVIQRKGKLHERGQIKVWIQRTEPLRGETTNESTILEKCLNLSHAYCDDKNLSLHLLKKIPVDHRHFWKIDRDQLRKA